MYNIKSGKIILEETIMKYKKWTDEDFAELARLNALGKTAKEIACILGCSDETVKGYKVKLGLSRRSNSNRFDFDKYKDTLDELSIMAVECTSAKGNSLFKCMKCELEWKARLFDVCSRKQECPECKPKHTSKAANRWLDELGITRREVKIPGTSYKVDGLGSDGITVYEFLGDYWHGNLEVFDTEDVNAVTGDTYGALFDNTAERLLDIKSRGYKVIYIWENDYLKGKEPEEM